MSIHKIVTVNASRQQSDPFNGGSRQITSGPRLTSHPEDSATIEREIVDEELQNDANAKDEMQTWMLLEVRSGMSHSNMRAVLQHQLIPKSCKIWDCMHFEALYVVCVSVAHCALSCNLQLL